MKAMVCNEWGSPDVFTHAELEVPEPGPGQVRIRVAATSVNPVDTKIRAGRIKAAPAFPAVLHGDVAGVVDAIGPGVSRFAVGDRVHGCAGGFKGLSGALAEYMIADARALARVPEGMRMREAAAMPLVSITAWLALVDRARVKPTDHVLIHAGAGGVGHVAVGIARAIGARVAATVSTEEKARIATNMGADDIIYYRDETVPEYLDRLTRGTGFDVVFDTVGGENIEGSLSATRISGHMLGIAMRTTANIAAIHERNLTVSGVFMVLPLLSGVGLEHFGDILTTLDRWYTDGRFAPVVHPAEFALEQIADAHRLLEEGSVSGKIVVDVS
ncbi:MAG: quinone oxidoreductase [Spirochaetaceae bacterium]|nr:MAG: quinone oxidoreductase [Spirochaetaceae bacterium]